MTALLAMTGLAVVTRIALDQPAGQSLPKWIGLPFTAMLIPLMLIILAVLTPQRSLRISSRGLCFASTCRRKRRWVRWEEITGVWPGLRRIRCMGGEVHFFHFQSLPQSDRKELQKALRSRLSERFDLSRLTQQQIRLERTRTRWTWRWLADRAALFGLGFAPFTGMMLFLWLWSVHPALMFAAWAAVMAGMFRAFKISERRNWIAPRASLD